MSQRYDYEAEQRALERQMQIAAAMQAQGMAPMGGTEMAGGVAIARSPMEGLAKVLQAYIGRKGIETVEGKMQTLRNRQRADLRSGVEKFIEGVSTQPGMQPATTGNNPSAYVGPTMDGPEDAQRKQREAVFEALASTHPTLQALGKSQLEAMKPKAPDKLTLKDVLPYADPTSIPQMVTGGMPGFKPKAERPIEVDGVLLEPGTYKVIQAVGSEPVHYEYKGDLYERNPTTGKSKKLDNATKVTTTLTNSPVIAGQKEGMSAVFKNAANKIDALGTQATLASENLQALSEMRQLDKNGIFSNVTTGPATFLTNLGQAVGVPVDAAKLGNTEAFAGLSTDLWQGVVSKYGGNRGVTKEEALELKKIVPQAANSPEARQRLYTILEAAAKRQQTRFRNANRSFLKAAQADDVTLLEDLEDVQMPEPTKAAPVTQPAGKGPTVRNW